MRASSRRRPRAAAQTAMAYQHATAAALCVQAAPAPAPQVPPGQILPPLQLSVATQAAVAAAHRRDAACQFNSVLLTHSSSLPITAGPPAKPSKRRRDEMSEPGTPLLTTGIGAPKFVERQQVGSALQWTTNEC